MLVLLFLMALFVAYANGANDNFKGVATLYGSNVASYRTAITLATITTAAGALASVLLAAALVKAFSGKGLVPDLVAASPRFLLAVAIGAGCTVILATLLAFPVSTTHGLTGALAGAGLVAAGAGLNLTALGGNFFLPLLVSPIIAIVLTMALYRVLHRASAAFGLVKESCVCLGQARFVPTAVYQAARSASTSNAPAAIGLTASVGTLPACVDKYSGAVWGVSAQRLLNAAHYCSAGCVSFARGLNDTPKIVALLLVIEALDVRFGMLAVAAAMAAGGLLNARKVAHTMSRKIAAMNDGQAFTANVVTALLVIVASRFGLPVSTTHVSVGAITGVGVANGSANTTVLRDVVMSWILTLPIAAAISAGAYCMIAAVSSF